MMPDILAELLANKRGTPFMCFDGMEPEDKDTMEYSDEQHKIARERYEGELLKIIAGFHAAKKLSEDFPTEPDKTKLEEAFDVGMKSFHKYFFTLWD
jgi:hypothetical protein